MNGPGGDADVGRDSAPGSTRAVDAPDAGALAAVLRGMVDRMAHQLKNPLQAIVVNLEVIRVRAAMGTDEAGLDSFARAVEEGVHLLDRRLGLLFLVARGARETAASVAPLELADDLVGALHLDQAPAAVRVVRGSGEGANAGATAWLRPGHFVACLVRLLDRARERSAGGVEVRHDPDVPALEVRFETAARDRGGAGEAAPPPGTADGVETAGAADRWREVVELARAAGAEAERRTDGGTEVWVLRFAAG